MTNQPTPAAMRAAKCLFSSDSDRLDACRIIDRETHLKEVIEALKDANRAYSFGDFTDVKKQISIALRLLEKGPQ